MSRLLRALLLGLITTVFLLPGQVASAHDVLLDSDPAEGASLDEAPTTLTLTFSGQITDLGAQISLTGGSGAGSLVAGPPRVEGTRLVQDLAEMGPGDYEVLWRVTSEDGHPISGSFSFEVTEEAAPAAGASPEATGEATDDTTDAAQETDTTDAAAPIATDATDSAQQTTAPATDDHAGHDADHAGHDAGNGVPGWAWVVVGAAVLALIALLARTVLRARG
ncbi:copper resistance CopC family protein [Ornithinimicrobium sp. Y1847]|uniref:copper resistance CopC family protein n=1 Tax=Ornithinimicrobium sp. Y1847 TaxID=3405419 RepID=UPI003B67C3EC